MTPGELADAVLAATAAVLRERNLDPSVLPGTVSVARPRNPDHGDYSSTVALLLAHRAGLPALELARAVAVMLSSEPAIQSVEVAGPGFLNIRLRPAAAGVIAGLVLEQGEGYGHGTALTGQRVNLEFVSANPTGPIHLGGCGGPPSVTRWPGCCAPRAPP
jgi:arginyl-tRNA synthetase